MVLETTLVATLFIFEKYESIDTKLTSLEYSKFPLGMNIFSQNIMIFLL